MTAAIKNERIGSVQVDFHGGEPLLMRKKEFEYICTKIKNGIAEICNLSFVLQTNGMLVDHEWISIFSKFNISIGVSLDGPEHINDRNRVDNKGHGTFREVMKGINLLLEAKGKNIIKQVGVLCVVADNFSGAEAYKFFLHVLKVSSVNFLLPSEPHCNFTNYTDTKYGNFLCQDFDAWVDDGSPKGVVRLFDETVASILYGEDYSVAIHDALRNKNYLITVSSNGFFVDEDILKIAKIEGFFTTFNIREHSFSDCLASNVTSGLIDAKYTLPNECAACSWHNIFQAGSFAGGMVTRFSRQNGFNNPSVNCGSLKTFYLHVAKCFLEQGFSYKELEAKLLHNGIDWKYYKSLCQYASKINTTDYVIHLS